MSGATHNKTSAVPSPYRLEDRARPGGAASQPRNHDAAPLAREVHRTATSVISVERLSTARGWHGVSILATFQSGKRVAVHVPAKGLDDLLAALSDLRGEIIAADGVGSTSAAGPVRRHR